MSSVAPTGWPRQVRPPDAPDWERTAVLWLFDISPPEFRQYPALRLHVVVLARFAVGFVEAQLAAVRRGVSEARGLLVELGSRAMVQDAVEAYLAEEARLIRLRREVGLVEAALQGRRFRARL